VIYNTKIPVGGNYVKKNNLDRFVLNNSHDYKL